MNTHTRHPQPTPAQPSPSPVHEHDTRHTTRTQHTRCAPVLGDQLLEVLRRERRGAWDHHMPMSALASHGDARKLRCLTAHDGAHAGQVLGGPGSRTRCVSIMLPMAQAGSQQLTRAGARS